MSNFALASVTLQPIVVNHVRKSTVIFVRETRAGRGVAAVSLSTTHGKRPEFIDNHASPALSVREPSQFQNHALPARSQAEMTLRRRSDNNLGAVYLLRKPKTQSPVALADLGVRRGRSRCPARVCACAWTRRKPI